MTVSVFGAEGYMFTTEDNKPVQNWDAYKNKNIPYMNYLKFYTLNSGKINAEYIYLSHSDENKFLKMLDTNEKENYKYVKKIQKLIANNKWEEVFSQYPNYYPAYLQYYDFCYGNKNYNGAIFALNKIKILDSRGQIFSQKVINLAYADLHFKLGQYANALNYYKIYELASDDSINFMIAKCYYNMGDYTEAISYCNKLSQQDYDEKELVYDSYMRLKEYKQANKYAKELLQMKYNYENLMRVQAMEENDSARLSYCYHARDLAKMEKDIRSVNKIIADLEQKKLDEKLSNIKQFIKVPKWNEIASQLPVNITLTELETKQDEFFKTANLYISQYKGQDLVNAFSSLTQEYNNYIQIQQNKYFQEQQFQLQQRILDEQQRQNELREQLIYEQQVQRYLDRQYFYMSHPEHYRMRHPMHHSPMMF